MFKKLLKKLFKITEAPEPKGVLKLVKSVPAKKLDINVSLDNGEIINTTVSGKTKEFISYPLNLGYNRTFPKKFLGLLDQYGLTKKQYDSKYRYCPTDKIYVQARFDQDCLDADALILEVTPGTTVAINTDRIRKIQVVENHGHVVEVTEHKVKEE